MSEELKPCPFCGKAVTIADYGSYLCIIAKETDPKVRCRCRLFMESEQFSAADEEARQRAKKRLIEKWNNRPSPWRTETPTEAGWYVFDYGSSGEQYENLVSLEYLSIHQIERYKRTNKFKDTKWQKIELYKEKKNE